MNKQVHQWKAFKGNPTARTVVVFGPVDRADRTASLTVYNRNGQARHMKAVLEAFIREASDIIAKMEVGDEFGVRDSNGDSAHSREVELNFEVPSGWE